MASMTSVTLIGLVAGAALILTAILVFVLRRDFPAGGVGVTVVGLALIGMSQWSTIKISAGGANLEVRIRETAEAAAAVAEEAQRTATAVEATRRQVVALAGQLEDQKVLPAATTRSIRTSLEAVPRVDLNRLQAARLNLSKITPK